MNCPKCQTAAAAGALFCPRCGAPLPKGSPAEPDSIGNLPTFHDGPEPLSIGEAPTLRQPRARRVKPGDLFLRRYRVLSELGQGGMGVVYRCQDEVGGIEVALKALPPELSQNSGEMEEVRENFRIVEKLYHPGIAAVKTLEKDAHTGDYYLVLELAQGVDLRRWRKQQGGKLSLAQAIPLLRQVALALDFGLAAQIQSSLSRVSQTHFSTSGTGSYMAPEQWRGQRQDGATDQICPSGDDLRAAGWASAVRDPGPTGAAGVCYPRASPTAERDAPPGLGGPCPRFGERAAATFR